MSIVQFVQKLLTILKNQPQVVQWINNGKQFQIIDVDLFTQKILPANFRHRKFQSFIRQLNMYGFHKVNRRKNSYVFEHEFFVENKEEDYCRIKRAKKNRPDGRAKPVKSTEIQINTMVLSQKAPKMAELLQKLVDFNTKNEFDYRKLKSKLDLLSRQVSAKKQRNLRPIIKNIREKILMLEETQRNISTMNWTAFSNCYQDSPTKTEQSEDMFEKQRKIMSAPIFGMKCDENAGFQQVSLNNICSFKSISSFIAFG